MKNFPYPNKNITTLEEIKEHTERLVNNSMNWLLLEGYTWHVSLPDEPHFNEDKSGNAGANIVLEYPYKKFTISIQQGEIDKCLSQKKNAPFWVNYEAMIIHELVHVILWRGHHLAGLRYVTPTDIDDENEFTTDHITNIITSCMREIRNKK